MNQKKDKEPKLSSLYRDFITKAHAQLGGQVADDAEMFIGVMLFADKLWFTQQLPSQGLLQETLTARRWLSSTDRAPTSWCWSAAWAPSAKATSAIPRCWRRPRPSSTTAPSTSTACRTTRWTRPQNGSRRSAAAALSWEPIMASHINGEEVVTGALVLAWVVVILVSLWKSRKVKRKDLPPRWR